MTGNLIYSLNAVAPIIIIIVLGAVLRKIGFLNAEFVRSADKLVFRLALPVYIFNEMSSTESGDILNTGLIVFCVVGVLAVYAITAALSPLVVKDKGSRGAFLQAVFRSNYAILGLPLTANLYGDTGMRTATLILPFVVPLFNILAVTALTRRESRTVDRRMLLKLISGIVKNPLIIAVAFGLIFMNIQLPTALDKTLKTVAGMSTPLALLSLGAGFSFSNIGSKLAYSLPAAVAKVVLFPIAATAAAVALGFRNAELTVIFVLFGTPTAVSSYIMAKNMGADHELAGQAIVFTTVLSAFTIFVGSYILRTLGLL